MLQTKNNGYVFLDFLPMKESEIDNFSPIAGSFAALECKGKFLLCYNKWREQWELPAGKREPNETPKECAVRELYEETGQQVKDLHFLGLLKMRKNSDQTIKHNPVYFQRVTELQPFQENNETTEILLWDLKEDIGFIDEVDVKLFDYLPQPTAKGAY